MFVELDYNKEIPKPKLYLATPNKKIISPIDTEPTINYKISNINDMTFEIPALIEKEKELENSIDKSTPIIVKNPLVDLIKERYLVSVKHRKIREWFMIIKKNDDAQESKDIVSVQCFSLAYELKDKDISYHTESSTLRQILLGNDLDDTKGILYNTFWTVGHIDSVYDKVYRDINFEGTVLNALLELPNIFRCEIDFDTENRKINIYSRDNYGRDTGIVFNCNKYLKSINRGSDADKGNMCTRLKVFGKDGVSINGVNPTGNEYIDDFTYFMYPFEMNRKGEIVKHSNYMSDKLCIALVNYKIKKLKYKGLFRNLVDKKDTYDKLKYYKNKELKDLNLQLNIFDDKLASARNSGNTIKEIREIKDKINIDVNNKKQEVKEIENILNNTIDEINKVREDLLEQNNFTNEQLEELYKYVIMDKTDIQTSNEIDLYNSGLKELAKKSRPKVNISLNLIDFMKCIDAQNMWDKLKLGDKIRVKYPLLNIDEKVRYGVNDYSPNDELIGGDI